LLTFLLSLFLLFLLGLHVLHAGVCNLFHPLVPAEGSGKERREEEGKRRKREREGIEEGGKRRKGTEEGGRERGEERGNRGRRERGNRGEGRERGEEEGKNVERFPKDHNQRDERGGRAHLTLSFSALRGMGFSSDTCSRRNTEGPNWSGGAILTRIPSNKNGYKREHIGSNLTRH